MIRVSKTTCEYAENPVGVDTAHPRFSWVLESDARAKVQKAYRALVSSSPEKLAADQGDKWDSGEVASERSARVSYSGAPLASAERCWWKVRVWDEAGAEGPWSEVASFEMGLMEQSDWQGCWIGAARGIPAPLLRKQLDLPARPVHARVYVSGIGWHELYVNGRKVGDHVLDPAAPEHTDSVLYVTHDVTEWLRAGPNAMGIWLGNGWYSEPEVWRYGDSPRAILQLDVTLEDGRRIRIGTDESWKVSGSCIVLNDFWHGEIYDARLEMAGWSDVGFDDTRWPPAERKEPPGGKLVSQLMPPIRVIQTMKPLSFTEPKAGVYVCDMGQLFGGWVRLRVKGPAGVKVAIKYSARLVEETGLVDKRRHEPPKATDYYVLKGDPEGEVYEPRFTYHPVRYVQIEGAPGTLTAEDVEGCVVHTEEDLAGDFTCSNGLLNQIHKNVTWTLTNGLYGLPLDCLHREHWAWTDPATITGSLYPRKHMPLFWTKWLRDIADSQGDDGLVPDICPSYLGQTFDAAWGGNYPILVWYLYRYYGDEQLLSQHYNAMKRCVEYMRGIAEDNIITRGTYGDHMLPGSEPGKEEFVSSETPRELVWTGYFYRAAYVLAEIARLVGNTEDAQRYGTLADAIKHAFNRTWFDAEHGRYATGSQTANIFPLALDIVPVEHRQAVLNTVVDSIRDRYHCHHHTGNTGTTCLIDKLTELGCGELLYEVVNQTTYPGWGYMVSQGATTIWESWSVDAGCGNAESMIMWATIDEFFYNDLAGIKGPDYYGPTPFGTGFRHIEIRPLVPAGLEHAQASIRTVRGDIASGWKKTRDGLILDVTVPVNATASVAVPKVGRGAVCIAEGERVIWQQGDFQPGADGVAAGQETADAVVFTVASGSYRFRTFVEPSPVEE